MAKKLTQLLQGGSLHLSREVLGLQEGLVCLLGSPESLLQYSVKNKRIRKFSFVLFDLLELRTY